MSEKTGEVSVKADEEKVIDLNDGAGNNYTHLTEEDLNPDYEPKTEETDKENTEKAETSTEEADPVVEPETDSSEVEDTSDEPDKVYNINGSDYAQVDVDRMANDYGHLSSFVGKQAEEIGGYKERIKILEEQMNADSPEQEKSAEEAAYDIYSEEGITRLANDIAEKKMTIFKEELAQGIAQDKYANDVIVAQNDFLQSHEEYKTEQDVVDLIQKGSDLGISIADLSTSEKIGNYFEHVHAATTGDYSKFSKEKDKGGDKPKKSTRKDVNKTVEKIMESNTVGGSLSDVGSEGGDDNVDYDKMDFDEWEKLPQSKRNELLGIS